MQNSDKFKELTLIEKIPVLEDSDGTIIYDSFNILLYLDEKYPQTYQMLPEDKAQVLIHLRDPS